MKGYIYLEAVLVVLIVGLALVPVMDSLRPGLLSTSENQKQLALFNLTRQKLEEVRSNSYTTLRANLSNPAGTPSAYSDTVTLEGATYQRQVILDLEDVAGGGSGDEGLIHLTVRTGDVQLETLRADYAL
jgi:type II secretory pathway pseudopilin PulG